MKANLQKGQLTKWKDDRGFGFIQPADGGPEVFFHISSLKSATRRPKTGDTIFYQLTTGKDGRICTSHALIAGMVRPRPVSEAMADGRSHSPKPTPLLPVLLQVFGLAILPLSGSVSYALTTDNVVPLILYPILSLCTFFVYSEDKYRAQQKKWRVPENTLHILELGGGWIGAFIAQRLLRHKNRKQTYQLVFWGIVILHQAFWAIWLTLQMT